VARSVTDIAVALGVMTGVDAADSATAKSSGNAQRDYRSICGRVRSTPIAIAGCVIMRCRSCANLTGHPDLIVPDGFSSDRLPVTISFFGPAWSEGKLIVLGCSFEQLTKTRRVPVNTPSLTGEAIQMKK